MDNQEKQIHDLLQKRMRDKRKAKRKKAHGDEKAALNLNSMMDMMTIILCFLLKNYGQEPIKVLPDMDLPFSTSEVIPKDMTTVTITGKAIVVMEQQVVPLTDRKVDKTLKKGGATVLIIQPLETALRDAVEEQKNFARQTKGEFQGEMTIIADVETPYRLIAEVMQTAVSTEFKKFRFAVIKNKFAFSGAIP